MSKHTGVVILGLAIFFTVSQAQADIESIFIDLCKDYVNNVEDSWWCEVCVEGVGITGATVTPPGGTPIALEDWGDGEWGIEHEYDTLADLNAVWPTGTYAFSFNGGADSVELEYDPDEPTGYAHVTYPTHGQRGVPLDPTFEWNSVGDPLPFGDGLSMWVIKDPQGDDEDVSENHTGDMTTTSWQPDTLEIETEYAFELSVSNLHGGAPQTEETQGKDEFMYYGVFEYCNWIEFSTDPDIEEIAILKEVRYVAGGAEPDPYVMEIWVSGTDITSATVEDPNGTIHVLTEREEWEDGDLGIKEPFAQLADLNTAFPSGNYIFTFNGGAGTVTIDFAETVPAAVAGITYPSHLQPDVEINPLYRWGSVSGMADAIFTCVHEIGGAYEDVYEQLHTDTSTISWQPGPLEPAWEYELEVTLANGCFMQPMQTDQADAFQYLGAFANINFISFQTAPAAAAGIESIWIDRCKDYVNNVEDSWLMEVCVEGVGITGATVTPPGGIPIALEDWGDGEWGIEHEYDTLADLNAAWPTGTYALSFNGGDDSVELEYAPDEPTGYAHVTYPTHGQRGVRLNPTFEWNSADGFGAHLGMWVIKDPDGLDEDVSENYTGDMTTISWQPDTLEIETEYAFELSVSNFHDGAPQPEQTQGEDEFMYYGVFEYCNWIEFSTDPDISIISLMKVLTHENGVEDPNPYRMEIWIEGVNITSATVTPPGGAPIALSDWGDGEWGINAEYASLAALNAAWPSGDYDFNFNSGFDTVTVAHNENTAPTGFAPITSPTHGEPGVGTDPAFEWGLVTGLGDLLEAEIIKDPEGLDEDFYEEFIFDTSRTSCDPDPLDLGFEYQFGVAVINLEGENAPLLATDGGDAFQYFGAFVNHNRIAFNTFPLPDITAILIIKNEKHIDGVSPTDPYYVNIVVLGNNITEVSVEEPNGASYALADMGDNQWGLGSHFASPAARDAAFGSGEYDFTFNGGADTVTVSHTETAPGVFPNITSPDHQQTGVGPEPICEWGSMVGAGDGLALFLIKDPDGTSEHVWEEWPVDINTMSRQVGPLDPATEYQFEVDVANMEGDDVQNLQTDQGDDFQYAGVAGNNNAVTFETAPMPDIEEIFYERFKDHENGVAITNPWGIEIDIEGTDITSATVTPPGGGPIALEDEGDGEWEIEAEYASLAALNAAWPSGNYEFTFNNGFDSVTLSCAVPEPSGFAAIIYPAHLQPDVEVDPEYTWTSAAGLGDALGMWVVQNPEVMGGFDVYEDWNVDIDQTSWQPGSLTTDEDYEFELSVINFGPGTPATPSTVGGDTFGYSATFEFINIISFSVPTPALDVTSININQIKHHVDGAEVLPHPCTVDISVAGAGITDVSVKAPNTDVHVLVYDGLSDRWRHGESFASTATMLAAYGIGDYLFTFNGGADTVTLNFDAAQPGGFAVITYPDHLQNDVEQEPTFAWNSVSGQGSFLNMWVTMDGAQVYGNWGADINLISWQPGSLSTDEDYELGLAVFNGGAEDADTDGGDPFTYSGTLEYINSIEFYVPPPAAAGIESIWIDRCKDYVNNVEDLWWCEVCVEGVGITSATVTPPGGAPIALEDWGDGEWGIEGEYDTLPDLNAAWPTGTYAFSFNGGADSVELEHDPDEPTGYAHVTYPAHQQNGVPLDPTLEWNSVDGFGAQLAMWVVKDPDGLDEDVSENYTGDMTTISWQPDTLEIETEYAFELSVSNFHGGAPQLEQTQGEDEFMYYGVFEYCNWIEFSTDPDIESIDIGKEMVHVNGEEVEAPYEINIWVVGANITSATVVGPLGAVHVLQQVPNGEWGIEGEYDTLAELNTAFPTGNYAFSFNNGFDTVTLSHNQIFPPVFANITNPDHEQTGVGINPLYAWGSVAGQGDALALVVYAGNGGEEVYVEHPVDINATSWQPGPLEPALGYELEVSVANLEGGDILDLATDQGDTFRYSGGSSNCNEITFETAPMPDIEDIFIARLREYENGIEITNPWMFEVYIEGTGITGGTVTSPGTAGELTLENYGFAWGVEQGFASQAALEAAFSTGDYVFSLNGGFATVTINYNVSAPTGFADVIDPEHGEHNVGQNPTITWGSVDGLGEAIIAWLIEDPDGVDEDIDEFFTLVMTTTSWEPNPLPDQTEFEVEISVANLDDGGLVAMQTDQDDDFTYEGWFDFCNVVCFDTLHWRVTGDATNDCKVDILDMLHIRNHLGDDPDTGDNWWADVTEDDKIDILDMLHVRNHLNESCPE